MLRNNHYSVFVSLRILLDQVLHGFHQQPLPFHITWIGFPWRSLTSPRIGHFWLDRKRKNLSHQRHLNPDILDAATWPLRCRALPDDLKSLLDHKLFLAPLIAS